MVLSEISIHLMNKAPKVTITDYSDFSVVEIEAYESPGVKFFLYSPQQVTNFKNNLLWAFEKPIKIAE